MKYKFILKHVKSEEIIVSRIYSLDEILNNGITYDEILEENAHCDCQAIGDSNVVECGCDEYYYGFEVVETVCERG